MGLYEAVKKALVSAFKERSRPIPRDSSVSLTFTNGTPVDTEGYVEVTPSPPYNCFAIRYFKLTTDYEVVGNVIVSPLANPVTDPSEGRKLLAEDQDENIADNVIDAGDYDQWFILCDRFWLYGRTKVDTTADRTLTLKFGGKEVIV